MISQDQLNGGPFDWGSNVGLEAKQKYGPDFSITFSHLPWPSNILSKLAGHVLAKQKYGSDICMKLL